MNTTTTTTTESLSHSERKYFDSRATTRASSSSSTNTIKSEGINNNNNKVIPQSEDAKMIASASLSKQSDDNNNKIADSCDEGCKSNNNNNNNKRKESPNDGSDEPAKKKITLVSHSVPSEAVATTTTGSSSSSSSLPPNSTVRSNGDNDDDDDDDQGYESCTEGSSCDLLLPHNDTQTQNERWKKMFTRLVTYKEQHQNTYVPNRYKEDPQLGRWVRSQRKNRKKDRIPKHRADLLTSIGFVWEGILDEKWMEVYQRLVAYKNQHHSTSVPKNYKEDPKLASWIDHQRTYYKNKELSFERIQYLESIGFIWKLRELVPWMEMYERLLAYKQCHKSTLVPTRYTTDPRLGKWVANQRCAYKKGELLEKRTELLNSIDFVWF